MDRSDWIGSIRIVFNFQKIKDMAEIREIPLSEAKLHPACFLYVYADSTFLNEIKDTKHKDIITYKGFNEKKLMDKSAKKEGISFDAYKEAVREAFTNMYGCDPLVGLYKLASGETLAGKNWNEGIYGIGSLLTTYNDGKGITVTKDGHFKKNGTLIPDDQTTVEYANSNGTGIIYKRYYIDQETNTTYALRYHKAGKRYYADSYSLSDGNVYSPAGIHLTGADGSSMWGNIILNWINAFVNWLLGLFGITTEKEQLTTENTLPAQVEDGFAGVEPLISGSTMLMLMAAGGMLLYGSTQKKKKGGKRKEAAAE